MTVVEEAVCPALKDDTRPESQRPALLNTLRSARQGQNQVPLSEKELRDEIVTMLLAGHETTAVTLSWAFYSIACHSHVAERFYAEVDDVVGQRVIEASDVPRLEYTRKIVDETLRLYPPVWVLARGAFRDDELGGYRIPATSAVVVSPYVIHRHPDFWSDPERFDPERFDPSVERREVGTYLPFLHGRHVCLGKHFALTETVVVLATIAQRYRMHLVSDEPACYEPLTSLRIRGGLRVRLEERHNGGSDR
jgi:cytochrome P450